MELPRGVLFHAEDVSRLRSLPAIPQVFWYLLPCTFHDAQATGRGGKLPTAADPTLAAPAPSGLGVPASARQEWEREWEGEGRDARPGRGSGSGSAPAVRGAPSTAGRAQLHTWPGVTALSSGTAPGAKEAAARPGREPLSLHPGCRARLPGSPTRACARRAATPCALRLAGQYAPADGWGRLPGGRASQTSPACLRAARPPSLPRGPGDPPRPRPPPGPPPARRGLRGGGSASAGPRPPAYLLLRRRGVQLVAP